MKPTKNRVFCYGCHRPKMLFETQQKADNFIHYNTDAILEKKRKAPVRSYYCEICNGWHVTSNPSEDKGEELNQREHRIIQDIIALKHKYDIDVEKIKNIKENITPKAEAVESLIIFGEIDEAKELTNACIYEIDEYLKTHIHHGAEKLVSLRSKFDNMCGLTDSIRELISMSEEDQTYYISNLNSHKDKEIISFAISNDRIMKEIDMLLNDNKKMLDDEKTDDVYENLDRCGELMSKLRGIGKRKMQEKYLAMFDEQRLRLSMLNDKLTAERIRTSVQYTSYPVDEKEYKKIIISLIERIEMIQKSFGAADYDSCETSLEIAYYMLDELHMNDDNTALIKQQLDQWSEKIGNVG